MTTQAIHFYLTDIALILNIIDAATRDFRDNPQHETYMHNDGDDEYICLRYGADRDCIRIYKVDSLWQPLQINNLEAL